MVCIQDLNGARADAGGLFGVAALNLSRENDPFAQDVLVVTPEPLTMILLGLGLVVAWRVCGEKNSE